MDKEKIILNVSVLTTPERKHRKHCDRTCKQGKSGGANAKLATNPHIIHQLLTSVLPEFYQHVDIATRGENTLNRVYTNSKNSYTTTDLPHVGNSDHLAIILTLAWVQQDKPAVREVGIWPPEANSAVKDCFEITQWHKTMLLTSRNTLCPSLRTLISV